MTNGFAPYNFVPFNEQSAPARYNEKKNLPVHNRLDGEYTGYIDYEIKNVTELAVEGERDTSDKQLGISHFSKDARGRYILPGSTMRGFFRSHGEIISNAYPEMVADSTYMFRKFADKSRKIRDEYVSCMMEEETTKSGNTVQKLHGVKAGYICKEKKDGHDVYYIIPLKKFPGTDKNYFQVHELDLRKAKNLGLDAGCYMYTDSPKFVKYSDFKKQSQNKGVNARELDKRYKFLLKTIENRNYRPYRHNREIVFGYENGKVNFLPQGKLHGKLLNSAYMRGKTHHYIVSAQEDMNCRIIVNENDVFAYRNDYERNCIQNKKLSKEFYALPDNEKGRKVFFYKQDEKGNLIGFGPTPYFRIFYKNSVQSGVSIRKAKGLDYIQAMFGYTYGKDAYKSRLSFENCVLQMSETPKIRTVDIYAGSPKGTAVQLYLEQRKQDVSNLNTFNAKGFKLRGYKFYWKRNSPVDGKSNGKSNTRLEVLPAGCTFKGRIYFENLAGDELGLLLYCLKFEDEKKESYLLGNGKQYGYGRIRLYNIKLFTLPKESRFSCIDVSEKNITEEIDEIKDTFVKKMKGYGIDILADSNESIQTYKKWIQTETSDSYLATYPSAYMSMNDKQLSSYAGRDILPTALDIMSIN